MVSLATFSMGPKVESACELVRKTGGVAAIGALEDAVALVRGEAGTIITTKVDRVQWGDNRE
jgi:carbamate kinase